MISMKKYRGVIENNLENIAKAVFFWENSKGIGTCVRLFHHSFLYMSLILYAVHFFVPSLFFIVYGIFLIIWLQHTFLGGCVFTNVERKLIGNDAFFLNISTDSGTLFLSTIMLCVLSFELVIRNVFSL